MSSLIISKQQAVNRAIETIRLISEICGLGIPHNYHIMLHLINIMTISHYYSYNIIDNTYIKIKDMASRMIAPIMNHIGNQNDLRLAIYDLDYAIQDMYLCIATLKILS